MQKEPLRRHLKREPFMRFTNNIGFILLAVYLLCVAFVAFNIMIPSVIMGIIALAAAIFILMGR